MKKTILAAVIILLLQVLPAYAGVTIDPAVNMIITNVNLNTATTQTYDTISLTSNAIIINSKTLQLTPSTNANIKINTFDTASDTYNLAVSGTGALDLSQKVTPGNQTFNIFRGGVYDFAVTSNSTGWIIITNIPINSTPQTYTVILSLGGTLGTTGESPGKIFKCQTSNISANYPGSVTAVTLYVNISGVMVNGAMQEEHNSYAMTNAGGGLFVYYYGNDPGMLWGNKTIAFKADTNPTINQTADHIFVYSDECTGTDILNYHNTSYRGSFGNYTGALFSGNQNILEFARAPFLAKIGNIIYIMIMFLICVVIYIKTQSVMSPLIITFVTAASLVGSGLIPDEFRNYMLLLTAAATAAIFWRLGKSA